MTLRGKIIPTRRRWIGGMMALLAAGAYCSDLYAQQVSIVADRDNTLFGPLAESQQRSSGVGNSLFAGRTGQLTGFIRRALIRFDITGNVPAGAIIEEVVLSMEVTNAPFSATPQSFTLHRVTSDWGEGSSDSAMSGVGAPATTGDATWVYAFFQTQPWTTLGGDFSAGASGETVVDGVGSYNWNSTPDMVADVQDWLDAASGNFGWAIVGNESEVRTARRFASREALSQQPTLVVTYTMPDPEACCLADGSCMDVVAPECTNVLKGTSLGVGTACSDAATCCLPAGACDDANACTIDSCQANACVNDFLAGCTTCVADTDCNDANPCTIDTCGGGQCSHTNNNIACEDGDECTENDACGGGVCSGVPITGCPACTVDDDCADDNPCTDDECVLGVCTSLPTTASCDDGDACTTNDACTSGLCVGAALADCCHTDDECDDSRVCTDVLCVDNECVPAFNRAVCDDGDICTENDACDEGECIGAAIPDCCVVADDCDDFNSCTVDSCQDNRCTFTTIVGCNLCVVDVDCDDGNPCTNALCVDGVCTKEKGSGVCDDGDPCTGDDSCVQGTCRGTPLEDCCIRNEECDDDDVCTADTCVGNACVRTLIPDCNEVGDTQQPDPPADEDEGAGAPTPEVNDPPTSAPRPLCGIFGLLPMMLCAGLLVSTRAARRRIGNGARMKSLSTHVLLWLVATCALLGAWVSGGDGNPSDTGAATIPVSEYRYVGTKKCRSCHGDWVASWRKNAKGSSWDALKPETNSNLKVLAGLDPKADYRTDSVCLPCHSVGFGHSSGYVVPGSDTGETARRAAQRQGTSCESCHGPGSGFVEVMSDIMNRERPYRQAELHAAGLRRITREACRTCHTLTAPCIIPDDGGGTHPPGAVDVKLSDRHGFHDRIPLRYRITGGATGDGVVPARQHSDD